MKALAIVFLGAIICYNMASDSKLINSVKTNAMITNDNSSLDSLDFNVIKYDTSYSYIFPNTFKSTDLSVKEIMECERLLRSYIVDYNTKSAKRFDELTEKFPNQKFNIETFTIELKEYGRQYMAVLSDKGEKTIFVNCFCDPAEFKYRHRALVVVFDGGNCFFNFKVDLKNKKIFDFMENGVG
jgi:hypothetical protein